MSSGIDDRQAIFREPVVVPYCVLHKRHNCSCMKPKPNYDLLGYALAMRVMQSELYDKLDDTERAQCDELIQRGMGSDC